MTVKRNQLEAGLANDLPHHTPRKQRTMIRFLNIEDNETVHQRCLLVKGVCDQLQSPLETISVSTKDITDNVAFPEQTWPVAEGNFKALLFLCPGVNVLTFKSQHEDSRTIRLTYVPLTQIPPLHLAIMVAKDSPLLIDCPPAKRGGISSTHSDLDAAVAKLRMTAYMWQALTAESIRSKGLGRRSFRLEEEWTVDTISRTFMDPRFDDTLYAHGAMGTTAKVHVVPTDKTMAQLRDPNVAQQNPSGRRKNDLYKYFEAALKQYGAPFISSARPVVAGMILDSHYSMENNLILGHAALGCHNQTGLSLGMMGSHLTYSFPRFVEEVSACLLDVTNPGDTVANDNDECDSMWEACSIGQGAFLHKVGHAFGADGCSGIMARGYSEDWPKAFLPFVSQSLCRPEFAENVVTADTFHEADWDLNDALHFRTKPHFRLPTDPPLRATDTSLGPSVTAECDEDEDFMRLVIKHDAGIARIIFSGEEPEAQPNLASPQTTVTYNLVELEQRFDRTRNLQIVVLAMNGKCKIILDVWRLLAYPSHVLVPGSSTKIMKQSIMSGTLEYEQDRPTGFQRQYWNWATLLWQRGASGKLVRANKIDLRVGCTFDGAVVYFTNGEKVPCGPRYDEHGRDHNFGGHASKMLHISENVSIRRIEINKTPGLDGIRIHLSDGTSAGSLNNEYTPAAVLEPPPGSRIIGLYGRHGYPGGYTQEFGILTWPEDQELPETVYELPELKNTDGGLGERPNEGGQSECGDEDYDDENDDDEGNGDEEY